MSEKKGRGSKLNRTQVVTVRLDPKLRYFTEIAARRQRRTVSGFIEWAIEEGMKNIILHEDSENNVHDLSISNEPNRLYDVDESERFARLAILYPQLLNHDEQVLWKIINNSHLMLMGKPHANPSNDWNWALLQDFVFPILYKNWELFVDIAEGREERSKIPDFREDVENFAETIHLYSEHSPENDSDSSK